MKIKETADNIGLAIWRVKGLYETFAKIQH